MLIQTLSAKLGIATGRNLPGGLPRAILAPHVARPLDPGRADRDGHRPRRVPRGGARASTCSSGSPLFPAALVTGVVTFVILGLQRFGLPPFEAVIAAFVGVIGVCYVAELFYAHPPLGTVAKHAVMPEFAGQRVGAARGRDPRRDRDAARDLPAFGADAEPHRAAERRRGAAAFRYTKVDVVIAMSIAGLINMAMLVMAASVFYKSGITERRLARDRAQDAGADPRRSLEHALRARAARVGAVELDGRARSPARS